MRSNNSVINVYKKKNIKSKVVTQLLCGDTFKKLKKNGIWIKIKNDNDNYKGYIKNKNFQLNQKNTPQSPFSQSTNSPEEAANVVRPSVPTEASNAY